MSDNQPTPTIEPASTGRHPLIEGLLLQLPASGETWTATKRDRWLDLAKLTVEMLYDVEESKE